MDNKVMGVATYARAYCNTVFRFDVTERGKSLSTLSSTEEARNSSRSRFALLPASLFTVRKRAKTDIP